MELPAGLQTVRTAGPFDADSLPAGLRRTHLVADHTWGVLRVIEGAIGFEAVTSPATSTRLVAGDAQPIPPGVRHQVRLDGPVVLAIDFLTKSAGQ
jgi:tellurite resistance-related uncharacterized protein